MFLEDVCNFCLLIFLLQLRQRERSPAQKLWGLQTHSGLTCPSLDPSPNLLAVTSLSTRKLSC